ncbi:winged helix-turn-helix domain-containing protein [Enterococcus sp. LJL90]
MKQIIILTQNYMINQELRENLTTLGYEVLCSTDILHQILYQNDFRFLNLVNLVFFSESIADETLSAALAHREVAEKIIFRIDSEVPSEETTRYWQERGVDAWLKPDSSLKEMREALSEVLKAQRCSPELSGVNGRNDLSQGATFETSIEAIQDTLSSRERKLFKLLYQEKGQFLTRKEVAARLWQSGPTESHLAQLSQLVSRIRLKIHAAGFPSGCIETHWKKGYRISDEMLGYLSQNNQAAPSSGSNYLEIFP